MGRIAPPAVAGDQSMGYSASLRGGGRSPRDRPVRERDHGAAEVAPLRTDREFRVVDAEEVQERRLEIVDRDVDVFLDLAVIRRTRRSKARPQLAATSLCLKTVPEVVGRCLGVAARGPQAGQEVRLATC